MTATPLLAVFIVYINTCDGLFKLPCYGDENAFQTYCVGHDDAMMLILAGHCGGAVNVLGVSTVAGNMPLSHTTANALKVLYISGNEHIRELTWPLGVFH